MSNPCQLVRDTCASVLENSTSPLVVIDVDSINRLAQQAPLDQLCSPKAFDHDIHYVGDPELTVQYLLCVDTLNFCFWPTDGALEYDHLARGIKNSVLHDPHCIDADALSTANEQTVRSLMRWTSSTNGTPIPLITERARLLREVGAVLLENFGGKAINIVKNANNSAVSLVSLIVQHFPGFGDHCIHPATGQQIFLYKRAQIFVGDVYGAFQGTGIGNFHDIDELTMFADYRVPAVLRELSILRYCDAALERKIDSKETIAPGSVEEIEIRAATVMAVEKLKAEIVHGRQEDSIKSPILSVCIDWWLWEMGERDKDTHRPHHRVMTIYY